MNLKQILNMNDKKSLKSYQVWLMKVKQEKVKIDMIIMQLEINEFAKTVKTST